MQAEHTWLARVSPTPTCACKGRVHAKSNADSLHPTQFFILACLFLH